MQWLEIINNLSARKISSINESTFKLCVEKPKPKYSQLLKIRTKVINWYELKVKTGNQLEAQENVSDQAGNWPFYSCVFIVAKPLIWSEAEGDFVVIETKI